MAVEEWLFWQMGGVGPMAGQAHHFLRYAPTMDPPQVLPYAQARYRREVGRLYGVLDKRLAGRDYVAGDYSIADMAIWPWAMGWENQQQDLAAVPEHGRLARPGGRAPGGDRGRGGGADARSDPRDRAAQRVLFGTDATPCGQARAAAPSVSRTPARGEPTERPTVHRPVVFGSRMPGSHPSGRMLRGGESDPRGLPCRRR